MKIAIAGYGMEGKASYAYYAAQGGHKIVIADERTQLSDVPMDAQQILGEGAFGKLQDFDLVIRTASLNPKNIQTNGKIWSATNEFFARCPAQIIGVTGTKGKGTTAALTTSILRAAGKTVHLLGNIGVPALEVLPKIQATDIVVYELSSFQLWDLEKSPHVAIILYMEPDHLDVHADMDEYVHAKANIRTHQTLDDFCFYHPENEFVRKIIEMPSANSIEPSQQYDWKWRAFRYCTNTVRDPSISIAYLESRMFCIRRSGQETPSVIPVAKLKIPGEHNQQNACAAIDAALVYGVSDEEIAQGLESFNGLPHRLQLVREHEGITYYNDSIATTPGSAAAAMQAIEMPKVMIFGGSSKGADFSELGKAAASSDVRIAIVVGQEAANIEAVLRNSNVAVLNIGSIVGMPEIVAIAKAQAKEGDAVVLSPACASFDMFSGYEDRGNQFNAAVNAL